jgi:hypothetical protein
MAHVTARLAASMVAASWLLGCGESTAPAAATGSDAALPDATPPAPDGPPSEGTQPRARLETADGDVIELGPRPPCAGRFCPAETEDAPADATTVYVDDAAPPDGDGTAERPLADLDAALGRSPEGPLIVFLAAGRYPCPGPIDRPLALVGAGAANTFLDAPGEICIDAAEGSRLTLAQLSIAGGRNGVRARGLDHLRLHDVRVTAPDAQGVALRAEGVNTVEVVDAVLSGSGAIEAAFIDSGAVVRRSVIGPSEGAGLVAGPGGQGAPRADCVDAASPVCPYAHFVQVEETLVEAVEGRGIESALGILRLSRVQVREVRAAEADAIGILMVQSRFTATDLQVQAVDGRGLVARSSRGEGRTLRVVDARQGGIDVGRLPPMASEAALRLRPFPVSGASGTGPLYPEPQILPPPTWAAVPAAFGNLTDYPEPQIHPGAPWFESDVELPPVLRAEGAPEGHPPEIELHRWARIHLEAPVVEGGAGFGIALGGHATVLERPTIRGLTGPAATALLVSQREAAPLQEVGASVVSLGRIVSPTIEDNRSDGLSVLQAVLLTREGADVVPYPAHRMRIDGGRFSGNEGVGVLLAESAVAARDLSVSAARGVGIWSYGAFATLEDTRIDDTGPATLPGREASPVEAADGLVLQGSPRWARYTGSALDVSRVAITGSARVGVLVVADAFGFGGRVDLSAADVRDNRLFDAAVIGDAVGLERPGDLRFESVTPGSVPPARPAAGE